MSAFSGKWKLKAAITLSRHDAWLGTDDPQSDSIEKCRFDFQSWPRVRIPVTIRLPLGVSWKVSWRRRATAESSCGGFSIVRRKLSGRVQWSASSASQSDSHWSKQSSPLLLYTRRNDFPSFSTSSPNRFPSLGCTFNRKKRLRAVRVAFSLQVNFVELGSELESVKDDQSF